MCVLFCVCKNRCDCCFLVNDHQYAVVIGNIYVLFVFIRQYIMLMNRELQANRTHLLCPNTYFNNILFGS